MRPPNEAGPVSADPKALLRDIAVYAKPVTGRSLWELAVTAVPFLLLLVVMWVAVGRGQWAAMLLALPAGGLLVRLFLIQHDCGHGSFFRRRAANDWVGRALSVLTVTPYDYWRRTHAIHHAGAGNLAKRGVGDVETLTVREFRARSRWGRLRYRLYRHPAVMFGIGPAFIFLLQHRLPIGFFRAGWRPWTSAMGTNASIAVVAGLVIWQIGWMGYVAVYLPVLVIAATIGVWLFYVQHQFEHTHWEEDGRWSFHHAALHGSSHFDLPPVLRWFTANIGVHHVHHLSSRIPFYRLGEVLLDRPALRDMGRLTFWQSFRTVPLALWDEEQRRLVSFREARAAR